MLDLHSPVFIEMICEGIMGYSTALDSEWIVLPSLDNEYATIEMKCWCKGPVLIPYMGLGQLNIGEDLKLQQYRCVIGTIMMPIEVRIFLGRCKMCGRVFVANAISR